VHVISQKRLREFWLVHSDSEAPLRAWHRIAERERWRTFSEIKQTCANTVDNVGKCTVFNIGGNKYRLITRVNFDRSKVFVLHVLDHKDYDRGDWKAKCR
jgi:mRNA interferase HigB